MKWPTHFGWMHEQPITHVKVIAPFPKITGGVAVYEPPAGYGLVSVRVTEQTVLGRSDWNTRLLSRHALALDGDDIRNRVRMLFKTIQQKGGDLERDYRHQAEQFTQTMLDYISTASRTYTRLELPYVCAHDGTDYDRRGGMLHLEVHGTLIRLVTHDDLKAIVNELIEEIAHGVPPSELDGGYDAVRVAQRGTIFDRRRDLAIELPGQLRVEPAPEDTVQRMFG